MKFAQALKVPAFAPRAVLASNDTRTIAREILAMTQEEFSAAFKGSPMKRAKLRRLKRNGAVVLGSSPTVEDAAALRVALGDPEPLVRAHAAWALGQLPAASAVPEG